MIFIKIIESPLSWVIMWWCAKSSSKIIAESIKKYAICHGDVHSQVYIYEMKKKKLRVLSDLICDKLYFDDEPTLVEVILFSALILSITTERNIAIPPHNAIMKFLLPKLGMAPRFKRYAFDDDIYIILDTELFPEPYQNTKTPLKGSGVLPQLRGEPEKVENKEREKRKQIKEKKEKKQPDGNEQTDDEK